MIGELPPITGVHLMRQRDSVVDFYTYCERLAVGKRSALGKENSCFDGEVFTGLIDA